jgi:hypothetical protein
MVFFLIYKPCARKQLLFLYILTNQMNKNRNIPIFLQKQDNPKFSLKYIANKTKVLFLCTKFGLLRP